MSIFKRLLSNKTCSSKSIIKNSVIAGTIIFSGFGQDVMAKGKSYVAVEPLVCDLVKSIALPSDEVTCLVDRKQDVHDLKINPRQAQLLNSADKVFTLGKEMTPSMRNWESKKNTVVVGVSAIDVDDHSDHGGHDDHAEHSAKVDDHSQTMVIMLKVISNGQVNSSFLRVPTNGHLKKLMANMQILQ